MNNKITNTKVEVPKGTELNDKDYLNCLNSHLKEMSKCYVQALTEASNEILYEKYYQMFDNITSLQRDTFELIFKNGWYPLEEIEENKLNEKLNNLTLEYNDLEL